MSSFPKQASRRWRRRLVVGSVVLIALVSLGVLGAVALARATPGWWKPANAADPAVKNAADTLENGVVNQLHAQRATGAEAPRAPGVTWQSEPWTVYLHESDANAWLAASLPKWLANQDKPLRLPAEISELQASFLDGVVRVGARIEQGGQTHAITASVRPEIREDGALWLEATWVRVGRMPVPAGWLLERATDTTGGPSGMLPNNAQVAAVARVLAGREPAAKSPEIRLADGRRVRLLKIEPHEDQLWLTCRTEAGR